jgi:hypothetical protein
MHLSLLHLQRFSFDGMLTGLPQPWLYATTEIGGAPCLPVAGQHGDFAAVGSRVVAQDNTTRKQARQAPFACLAKLPGPAGGAGGS